MRFETDFWSSIPKKFHDDIRLLGVEQIVKSGSYLFNENDSYLGFYIVLTGKFRLFNLNNNGDEATISVLDKDQAIALVPIFTELKNNHAYCQAIENSSVLFIEKNAFRSLLNKKAELLFSIAKIVIRFTLGFRDKYLSLTLKKAEDRFVEFLSELNANLEFVKLPISKKHLASLLDITPESLSRLILKLKEGKIIIEKDGLYRLVPTD